MSKWPRSTEEERKGQVAMLSALRTCRSLTSLEGWRIIQSLRVNSGPLACQRHAEGVCEPGCALQRSRAGRGGDGSCRRCRLRLLCPSLPPHDFSCPGGSHGGQGACHGACSCAHPHLHRHDSYSRRCVAGHSRLDGRSCGCPPSGPGHLRWQVCAPALASRQQLAVHNAIKGPKLQELFPCKADLMPPRLSLPLLQRPACPAAQQPARSSALQRHCGGSPCTQTAAVQLGWCSRPCRGGAAARQGSLH